jgi:Cu(I)/Ag(I) efflux system membrane protein CusA/SilA
VGVKIYGSNLDSIYNISRKVEASLKGIEGLEDLYVEQLTGGKYLDIKIRRKDAARYGLNIDDVNMVIESALGGMILTTTVEGRERFSVNLRLAQEYRNDIDEIKRIPIQTMKYGVLPLSSVADVKVSEGPPMINSENAMLRGTVLFNVRGRDMGSVVNDAKKRIEETFKQLPQGYYIDWSGQYENQVRAEQRLKVIIPIVMLIIAFILYVTFNSFKAVAIVFISVPVALMGGVYSLYYYNVNFSVAVAVGFIALFGVAVETGVLMIAYLNDSIKKLVAAKGNGPENISDDDLKETFLLGATQRVRPLLMTVLANILGLIPVMTATGTGSDVMKPIAIPFVFGLITSTLFVLIVLPVIYNLLKEWELKKHGKLVVLEIKD